MACNLQSIFDIDNAPDSYFDGEPIFLSLI